MTFGVIFGYFKPNQNFLRNYKPSIAIAPGE